MRKKAMWLAAIFVVALTQQNGLKAQEKSMLVRKGETVAFLGASISEFGWTHDDGYLRLVTKNLAANGVEIVPLPVGVSGNTSRDMLARLERDVLSRKPNWVTIDAGGNDVWHNSVTFAEYMKNMTQIVDKARAARINVILQTCTPIGEDLNNEFNPKMAYFNDFLRYLASEKGCVLADISAMFVEKLKTREGTENILTTDGVHMNERGNRFMAIGLLRALGANETQIEKTIDLQP